MELLPGDDLPDYCKYDEIKWSKLHSTARAFVDTLGLPKVHPRCLSLSLSGSLFPNGDGGGGGDSHSGDFPIPYEEMNIGREHFNESSAGGNIDIHIGIDFGIDVVEPLITLFYQIAPPLLAIGELWLRFFACLIAPLVTAYLISTVILRRKEDDANGIRLGSQDSHDERYQTYITILGMAASIVLFTDTMYVQEYGRWNGGVLLFTTTLLAIKLSISFRSSFYRRKLIGSLVAMIFLAGHLFLASDGYEYSPGSRSGLYDGHHPGLDLTTLEEGLYYSSDNSFMSRVAEVWPEESRTYDPQNARSPLLPTGDARTGIPFLLNKAADQEYHRLWVESEVDDEAVAIDIAFPTDGHSSTKPVFFILHGLNGGSHEDYVKEFVVRRIKEGNTCIVMIARGLMDTPIFGWNVFHGARVTDLHASSKAVQRAIAENQILAGVGYSMGGIILSNYVARYGSSVHLDAAMAVSGGLDMREMLSFRRSMRLWQPMLAQSLRDEMNKFEGKYRQRLTKEQHLSFMRAATIIEVDFHAVVPYNGFDDLFHYYSEMSAMGDTTAFRANQNKTQDAITDDVGRIANVSIPFCVLHALDDPLTTHRTLGHDPQRLVKTGSGHTMMLLTAAGGHVGWPLGLNPAAEGWKWMNNAVSGFVNSVDLVKRERIAG